MALMKVFMLVLGCTVLGAQKTFQRSCECEYTVDGKCAYTLLLPASSSEEGGMCPSNTEELEALKSQLADVETQVTQLGEWSTEQTQLIAQLQSDLLTEVITKLSLITSCDCAGIDSTLAEHAEQLQKLQADLEQNTLAYETLNDTIAQLTASLNTVESEQAELKSQQDQLSSDILTLDESIQGQVEEIQDTFQLCAQKGIIVSGNVASIADEQITSSSVYNDDHSAIRSRIYTEADGNLPGGWCPSEPNSEEEWLEYDLGSSQVIYGVVTRGRADHPQWVTKYKLAYANEEEENEEGVMEKKWLTYNDVLGDLEVLDGNIEQLAAKTNMLWQPIVGRWVRIIALEANDKNKCMRADLIGCVDS